MFAGHFVGRPEEDEDRSDIFAPVADLMVGVVFIFVILMFALALNFQPDKVVPRSDYEQLKQRYEQLNQTYVAEHAARVGAETKLTVALAQNRRLVDFAHFVRDSNVKALLERLSRADQTRSNILTEMKQRLADEGRITVNVDFGAGTLALPSTSLFASGQADPIVPNGRDTILRLGSVMSEVLPCHTGAAVAAGCGSANSQTEFSSLSAVYVEGHTDVTPFTTSGAGRFRDNWDLSAARAIEAYKLIRDNYAAIRNLSNSRGEALTGVSGYADTRPASSGDGDRASAEAKDKDRRIEVRIIMSTNEATVGAVLEELNRRLEAVDDLVR